MERIAYLFTFWPPGPEDLLKVTSLTALLRMVSASSFASHFLAASTSSSLSPLLDPPRLEAKHRAARDAVDWRRGVVIGWRPITWRSITSRVMY